MYQWEGIRQLIANITTITNNLTIAFDHPSSTLLLLAAKYSQNVLLISDRRNKPLF